MSHHTCRAWNLAIGLLAILTLSGSLALSGGAALAETYSVGSIEIGSPWARATPKGAPVAGAYMTITNKGTEADRLIGVSSPVASQAEVHQMSMDNGVMSMRPVPGGLEIKPGQTVVLNPESFHLMLMGLKQPLAQGRAHEGDARFRKSRQARCRIRGRVHGGARSERRRPCRAWITAPWITAPRTRAR